MTAPVQRTALRTQGFTESVIREMTRLCHRYDGVNLSQGFPDFPAPDVVKHAAVQAVQDDINQYAITWGAPALREAVAHAFTRRYRVPVDPEHHVTICCGSTEAMISTLLATVDPGDEVIVFEPFYENYGPDAALSGATTRFVTLREPDWTFDESELVAAFGNHTKAIIINTPHNPTGKVFSRQELTTIARLCQQWGVVAITDEIYEHILYGDATHVPMATVEGMAEQTVTINSLSKTYSVTGWRVGWTIAPTWLTGAIRKVHDFLTVGAAAPLQAAGAVALALPDSYYRDLQHGYQRRRDLLLEVLSRHGFHCDPPAGAYYVMTDIAHFGWGDDVTFARRLVQDAGVAVVPGSSFYRDPILGRSKVRWCFCKRHETLRAADRRLEALTSPSASPTSTLNTTPPGPTTSAEQTTPPQHSSSTRSAPKAS